MKHPKYFNSKTKLDSKTEFHLLKRGNLQLTINNEEVAGSRQFLGLSVNRMQYKALKTKWDKRNITTIFERLVFRKFEIFPFFLACLKSFVCSVGVLFYCRQCQNYIFAETILTTCIKIRFRNITRA